MDTRRCSRLMIVDEKGRLLLFQYKDEHKPEPFWATAGGELIEGETYLDAAQRELYEETGLENDIGPLLMEREEVFAVARSTPVLWKEQYYLVNCSSKSKVFAAQWTEEEQSTIQKWKWWSLAEIEKLDESSLKPECLTALLRSILESRKCA